MFELEYRPAMGTDAPAIFRLCKDLIDAYEDLASIDYERVIAWVEEKIRSRITDYTCIYDAGEKVGYYKLTQEADGWELDDFYILPEHRGRGIGSQVLDHCLHQTDGAVYLYVFTENIDAIRLYQRFGFVVFKKVSDTRIIMRRDG